MFDAIWSTQYRETWQPLKYQQKVVLNKGGHKPIIDFHYKTIYGAKSSVFKSHWSFIRIVFWQVVKKETGELTAETNVTVRMEPLVMLCLESVYVEMDISVTNVEKVPFNIKS